MAKVNLVSGVLECGYRRGRDEKKGDITRKLSTSFKEVVEGEKRTGNGTLVPATCRSLLCTAEITCQKKDYFSYPSNKTLPFHSRNKIVRGISGPIKTDRVITVIAWTPSKQGNSGNLI